MIPPSDTKVLFVPPSQLPDCTSGPDPHTPDGEILFQLRTSGCTVVMGFDVVFTEDPLFPYTTPVFGKTFDQLEKPTARPWYNQFRGSGFKKHRGRF